MVLVVFSACLTILQAAAQGPGGGGGPGGPGGWRPGMMMGPGMMGRGGFGPMMCNPRAAGLAEWRMDRIENATRPNETQKAALDQLRTASTKAAELIAAACPKEAPATAPARLEQAEKRAQAMLQAVQTVRPAFDAFYAALDAEQKARLDAVGPRRWGWQRWRGGEDR
jgi:hypothetical protein